MVNNNQAKILNFLQDFGCAKVEQLQILYDDKNNNFKNILASNMVSKKGDIFIHNTTKRINEKMLIALDILCKYKGRFINFYQGYEPIFITFLTNENLLYHIIVADKENEKGIVKLVNSYPLSLPKADRLILAFPDAGELKNIGCDIPFLYTSYPGLEVLNDYEDEENSQTT